jgi:hypothetical protein
LLPVVEAVAEMAEVEAVAVCFKGTRELHPELLTL